MCHSQDTLPADAMKAEPILRAKPIPCVDGVTLWSRIRHRYKPAQRRAMEYYLKCVTGLKHIDRDPAAAPPFGVSLRRGCRRGTARPHPYQRGRARRTPAMGRPARRGPTSSRRWLQECGQPLRWTLAALSREPLRPSKVAGHRKIPALFHPLPAPCSDRGHEVGRVNMPLHPSRARRTPATGRPARRGPHLLTSVAAGMRVTPPVEIGGSLTRAATALQGSGAS